MSWTTVATFHNEASAQAAAASLRPFIASEIEAAVTRASRMHMVTDTWWLKVLVADYQKAYDTLTASEFADSVVPFEPHKLMGPCPKCRSMSIAPKEISTGYLALCVLLIGIPALFYRTTYECLKCGVHFKKSDIKDA